MALIVQKYGGSSLATPAHIQRAAKRIRKAREKGFSVVVVASAMGSTTDDLIELAGRTVKNPPPREMDMLLSTGERISMALLAMALEEEGVPAISFTGSQSGIITTQDHCTARIKTIKPIRTQEELAKGKVVIIAGFQGVSETKEITTLGRGGSDTTAVALAAVLGAKYCEILTDVDGLFSADPRLVKSAKLIPHCTYDEGVELATLGAKMHPRSLEVARTHKVPLWIGPSQKDEIGKEFGTWITDDKTENKNVETVTIKGIASLGDHRWFETQGPGATILRVARDLRIVLKHWREDGGTFRFACDKDRASQLRDQLTKASVTIDAETDCALLSAVGDGLGSCPDLLPRFLGVLGDHGIVPIALSSGSLSLTVVVDERHKAEGVKALHQEFIEETKIARQAATPDKAADKTL